MERCIFLETVGATPELKVLDLLIEGEEFDYSLTDITNESGVSWATVNALVKKLEKEGLIVHTRRIGSAKLFKINGDSPRVRAITDLHNKICGEGVEELYGQAVEA